MQEVLIREVLNEGPKPIPEGLSTTGAQDGDCRTPLLGFIKSMEAVVTCGNTATLPGASSEGDSKAHLVEDVQEWQQQHDANIGERNAHKDLLPKCVNLHNHNDPCSCTSHPFHGSMAGVVSAKQSA